MKLASFTVDLDDSGSVTFVRLMFSGQLRDDNGFEFALPDLRVLYEKMSALLDIVSKRSDGDDSWGFEAPVTRVISFRVDFSDSQDAYSSVVLYFDPFPQGDASLVQSEICFTSREVVSLSLVLESVFSSPFLPVSYLYSTK